MKPVIVTGGAGFIGSHTCKRIAEAGYLPVTVDNLSTGHADHAKWGPLCHVDVRNSDAMCDVIQAHGAKTVIHFAASAYVGESVVDPLKYYDNNVGGMLAVMDAARKSGVESFIFSSSCATYGIPNQLPISEEAEQNPINPYGRTKLVCEQMLRDVSAAHGIRHAILRYFNAAGCDPSGDLSERHDPETHLIPLALRAAFGLTAPLEVFGTDYDTPDGTCIRDYIHVSDLADGHLAALKHLEDAGDSISINLGTGSGCSILEVLSAIEQATGRKVPVRFGARREGDPAALVADVSKANRILGFKTRYSDIDTIVKHAAPTFGMGQADADCA
ncbi:MAG: UDP-glucose 4-epimerase GalE [Rhodobacteraceae bacterium]|nr:UDP-glucose 4-epimerase GalE [Paracoccaceae bacterium]